MANISQQTMAGWYKNFLLLNAATNVGVLSTPVYLQDGNGGAIPLAVSKTGLQVSGAAKLHFRDTGVYIHSSGTNVLKLAGTNIKLYGTVSITGKTTGVSAELVSGLTASVIRTTNLTTTGKALIGTCSATTIKGTNVNITGTVSCASIKSSVNYTGKTETIKLAGNYLYLYGASVYAYGNASSLIINPGTTTTGVRFSEAYINPTPTNTINLGAAASVWKSVYATTGTFTTANITTANLTNGTFTAIGAIGASKLTVSTVSMKSQFKLNSVSLYFNTAKTYYIDYNNSASAIRLKGTLFPSANSTYDLGTTTTRWDAVYTDNVSTTAITTTTLVGTGNLESAASLVGKYLSITGIPTSSTSVSIGGIYTVGTASTLMIRKT